MDISASLKTCFGCQQKKPLEAFYVCRRASDGRQRRCKPCQKAFMAAWYERNSERVCARTGKWKQANIERRRAANRAYREGHLAEGASNSLWHNAKLLNAIPRWVDRSAIEAIYARANALTKETGIVHQVDHIVPLRSKKVCGLHVANNLQVLTFVENRSKGNKRWPDMPEARHGY